MTTDKMTDMTQQTTDTGLVRKLLRKWISEVLPADGLAWVEEKAEKIANGTEDWVFFTSFSAVPRYTGKTDLSLDEPALKEANALRSQWNPRHWSVDQAARSLLILSLPNDPVDPYLEKLEKVFNAADIGESVVLYQSLPLYPHAERFVERAAEGLRSNMTSVFEAVALRNPFPSEYFEENAWNQLVLKCCFVGSALHKIVGLDERANATLARILVDYAHERWSASRVVIPELWRPVGPFATDEFIGDLERVINDEDAAQQEAGALALSQSPSAKAAALLGEYPHLKSRIDSGDLTWDSFSQNRLV